MLTKEVNDHIDAVLAQKIRPMLVEAAEIIAALKIKERIPATKLAEMIAAKHNLTGPTLYPTLKLLLDTTYPNVRILRGAHGGIERIAEDVDNTVVPVDSAAEGDTL